VRFSFDPAVIVLLVTATALYVRAVRVLGRRGQEISTLQQVSWHSGVLISAIGLLGPVDGLGEDLLSAHMAQHLLVADFAAPLLLIGVRTPVLQHMLPRAAMVSLGRARRLRAVLAHLRSPLVAIALYVLVLYGWHLTFMFEAALGNGLVHALQHQSFLAVSVLVWLPALEPARRRLRGELWKIGHIIGARVAGMFLGMAFVIMRSPAYEGAYGNASSEHGLTPLFDQQVAGGLMLVVDVAIMLTALAFFFWRAGEDHDRAERRAAIG